MGREHPAVASYSRESSFHAEDPLMTDILPVLLEPKVPMSVVHDVADDSAVFRGDGTGLCQISLRAVRVSGSCCPAQGIVRGWPGNRGSRRR